MALELIAGIVAAIAMAGIAMFLRKLSGGRIAKWIVPAAAGAGLIGYTIQSEYTWFDRVSAELPATVIVTEARPEAMALRPWTLLAPLVLRFAAVDTAATTVSPDNPDLRMVREIAFRRWAGTAERLLVVDCENLRRAILTEAVMPAADGTMTGADWEPVAPDDAMLALVCTET
jgi:hypothetical protein